HCLHVISTEAADGPGGAGQESVERLPPVGAGLRLGLDEGRFRRLSEDRRGDLPTGIAVDAGRVHEEVARDVLRHSLLGIGHNRASVPSFYRGGRLRAGGGRPGWLYPTAAAISASNLQSNMAATRLSNSGLTAVRRPGNP